MEKITSLAKKLQNKAAGHKHLRHLTLQQGEMFGWDHTACVITYNPADPSAPAYLLHEFGHAILEHASYSYDIDLLKMERSAWDVALSIAKQYQVVISQELVDDALDSYRDWLHSRSLCPICSATGVQSGPISYACMACGANWHVNDARKCALRRYLDKKRPL